MIKHLIEEQARVNCESTFFEDEVVLTERESLSTLRLLSPQLSTFLALLVLLKRKTIFRAVPVRLVKCEPKWEL